MASPTSPTLAPPPSAFSSTTAQDFGNTPSPRHTETVPLDSLPHAPSIRLPPPGLQHTYSPTAMDHPSRDRRGSVVSRMSTQTSPEGLRHRRPTRTNTITTYHEEPVPTVWQPQPGAEPGIDPAAASESLPPHLANLKADCDIQIVDFSDLEIQHVHATNATLEEKLSAPRPEGLPCRWISVNGISWDVIKCLGNKYHLHRLAIEDLIHTHTRTKVDWYAEQAYVCLTLQKLVRLHQHKGQSGKCDCPATVDSDVEDDVAKTDDVSTDPAQRKRSSLSDWWAGLLTTRTKPQPDVLPRYLDQDRDGKIDEFVRAHSGLSEESPIKPIRTLHRYESAQIVEHTTYMEKHSVLAAEELAVSVEQVSIFLLTDNTVISFFEQSASDVEAPLLTRLDTPETILRRSCDASLMLQALIDAIVDLAVPVKDAYNKARKELQIDAMTNPDIKTSRALHIFGEEIDMLQNLFKPLVNLVNALRDHNVDPLPYSAPATLPPPPPSALTDNPSTSAPSDLTNQASTTTSTNPLPKPGPRDREGVPLLLRQNMSSDTLRNRRNPLRRNHNPNEPSASVSITPLAHTYFGDVLDHCISIIQALEQMDASAQNITALLFNTVGAKTNNLVLVFTLVTVLFVPLTFLSGYFGMNFNSAGGIAHSFGWFWVVGAPVLVGFTALVFLTMLWENVQDFITKTGMRRHRRQRRRERIRRKVGRM